jgi:hypothetical protein
MRKSDALLFGWKVCKHVKSNAIVFARAGQTVGVGAGQMSRVDSVKIAVMKAQLPLAGSVVASDAFFPFPDGVEEAGKGRGHGRDSTGGLGSRSGSHCRRGPTWEWPWYSAACGISGTKFRRTRRSAQIGTFSVKVEPAPDRTETRYISGKILNRRKPRAGAAHLNVLGVSKKRLRPPRGRVLYCKGSGWKPAFESVLTRNQLWRIILI